ncbi:MAG: hypothetical protein IJ679_12455 [Lachnospiraceae bacterium]|nr:hypothetical protein [Lachnospiraceae bacterium]
MIYTALLVGVLMIGVLFIIQKKITDAFRQVAESAEQIGRGNDFSIRMADTARFREISALVNAHNRLLDRVEEFIDLQQSFNHNVSHELRTPIAVIQAQCQLLQEKYENDHEMMEVISRIKRQN